MSTVTEKRIRNRFLGASMVNFFMADSKTWVKRSIPMRGFLMTVNIFETRNWHKTGQFSSNLAKARSVTSFPGMVPLWMALTLGTSDLQLRLGVVDLASLCRKEHAKWWPGCPRKDPPQTSGKRFQRRSAAPPNHLAKMTYDPHLMLCACFFVGSIQLGLTKKSTGFSVHCRPLENGLFALSASVCKRLASPTFCSSWPLEAGPVHWSNCQLDWPSKRQKKKRFRSTMTKH